LSVRSTNNCLDAQAFVDLEGVVDVGIIDQSLPSNRRSWLLKYSSAAGGSWIEQGPMITSRR